MASETLPDLLAHRRALANELLRAAAEHSALSDELHDLEVLGARRPLTSQEALHAEELRRRRLEARQRHDTAEIQLKRVNASMRLH